MELFYIRQIIEGDIRMFSYFIEAYKDMSFSIAYRITNNKLDAEEVVQDSFLKTYRSLHKFRHDSKFSTWLYRIVINTALSKARKNKQNIFDDADVSNVQDILIDNVESTYKGLDHSDQKKFINMALEELKTGDSLLLTLYYLNGNSIGEITEITGIATENIKMKLYRARKKMYGILSRMLKTEIKVIAK